MSAEDALLGFSRMCRAVFPDKPCTPAERALNLHAITKMLLEECGISNEAKLMGVMGESNSPTTCKLYVWRILTFRVTHSTDAVVGGYFI